MSICISSIRKKIPIEKLFILNFVHVYLQWLFATFPLSTTETWTRWSIEFNKIPYLLLPWLLLFARECCILIALLHNCILMELLCTIVKYHNTERDTRSLVLEGLHYLSKSKFQKIVEESYFRCVPTLVL